MSQKPSPVLAHLPELMAPGFLAAVSQAKTDGTKAALARFARAVGFARGFTIVCQGPAAVLEVAQSWQDATEDDYVWAHLQRLADHIARNVPPAGTPLSLSGNGDHVTCHYAEAAAQGMMLAWRYASRREVVEARVCAAELTAVLSEKIRGKISAGMQRAIDRFSDYIAKAPAAVSETSPDAPSEDMSAAEVTQAVEPVQETVEAREAVVETAPETSGPAPALEATSRQDWRGDQDVVPEPTVALEAAAAGPTVNAIEVDSSASKAVVSVLRRSRKAARADQPVLPGLFDAEPISADEEPAAHLVAA